MTPHQCVICQKEFGRKSNLFRHVRNYHGGFKVSRKESDKIANEEMGIFKEAVVILQRTDVALFEKNVNNQIFNDKEDIFSCKVCKKTFVRANDKERHHREVHQKMTPHQCAICQKEFGRKSNLSRHVKSCHGENAICKIEVLEDASLNLQIKDVISEKIANDSMIEIENMTDEPLEEAPIIFQNKNLALLENNVANQIFKDNEDAFSCIICKKKFARVRDKKRHFKEVHLQMTPHQCVICHKEFKRNCSLTRHVTRCHGENAIWNSQVAEIENADQGEFDDGAVLELNVANQIFSDVADVKQNFDTEIVSDDDEFGELYEIEDQEEEIDLQFTSMATEVDIDYKMFKEEID